MQHTLQALPEIRYHSPYVSPTWRAIRLSLLMLSLTGCISVIIQEWPSQEWPPPASDSWAAVRSLPRFVAQIATQAGSPGISLPTHSQPVVRSQPSQPSHSSPQVAVPASNHTVPTGPSTTKLAELAHLTQSISSAGQPLRSSPQGTVSTSTHTTPPGPSATKLAELAHLTQSIYTASRLAAIPLSQVARQYTASTKTTRALSKKRKPSPPTSPVVTR
jgi:hypothetical protein